MEKPSFILDFDAEPELKPLPYVLPRRRHGSKSIKLSEKYPFYQAEFFTTVNDCAKRIETLKSADLRKRYNDDLTRIFARRDFKAAMQLFTELIRVKLGEPLDHRNTPSH
jgi:hypothetical protein